MHLVYISSKSLQYFFNIWIFWVCKCLFYIIFLGKDCYNNLNVPVLQRKKHEQLCSLMLNMHGLVSDFCRQLSDLYTFLIQRLCSTSTDSSLLEIITRVRKVIHNLTVCMCTDILTTGNKVCSCYSNSGKSTEQYRLFQEMSFCILKKKNHM